MALAISCAIGFSPSRGTAAPPRVKLAEPTVFELVNGKWFNGTGFEERTVYIFRGLLTARPPKDEAELIDLKGMYVVPPFGDAHHHTLVYRAETAVPEFLKNGVFYAQIQAVDISVGKKAAALFNKPDSVDISQALAPITAPNAHPLQIGMRNGRTYEQCDGEWVHMVKDLDELGPRWPKILESKPDFIKIIFESSENYHALKTDPTVPTRYRGLDPSLGPTIVHRAHQAGLRVSAHVRTAGDFRNALIARVDEIAHTPGFSIGPESVDDARNERLVAELDDPRRFEIHDQDAHLAGQLGTVVVTTLGTLESAKVPKDLPPELLELARKAVEVQKRVHTHNMGVLKERGVPIAIGSDRGEGTVVDDVFYLASLGVFTNLDLLNMWCGTTARTIFPERDIGYLQNGYEASFLVLEGNPIEDLTNVRKIAMWFKGGRRLVFE